MLEHIVIEQLLIETRWLNGRWSNLFFRRSIATILTLNLRTFGALYWTLVTNFQNSILDCSRPRPTCSMRKTRSFCSHKAIFGHWTICCTISRYSPSTYSLSTYSHSTFETSNYLLHHFNIFSFNIFSQLSKHWTICCTISTYSPSTYSLSTFEEETQVLNLCGFIRSPYRNNTV